MFSRKIERHRTRAVIYQINDNVRPGGAKASHPRHQPAGSESRRYGDGESAAGALVGEQCLGRRFDLGKRRPDIARIVGARRRQGEAAAHAEEQLDPKQRFELGDLTADAALGQLQFVGCPRNAQMSRSSLKCSKQRSRRSQAWHGYLSSMPECNELMTTYQFLPRHASCTG